MVDAYSSSLTRTTPTTLATARYGLAGASVGSYALFAGGYDGQVVVSAVEAYNGALTRSTATTLSTARCYLAGAKAKDYIIFAGGSDGTGSRSDTFATADAYSPSLTRSAPTALSSGRSELAGASVGEYALFCGGRHQEGSSTRYENTADAYTYSEYSTYSLAVPPLSAYKFEGLHSGEQVTVTGTTLTGEGKLTGYIRAGGFTISGKQ